MAEWIELFLAYRLSSDYSTFCCKGILVSPKIRVLPTASLSQHLNLVYFSGFFATARPLSQVLSS